MPLGIEDKRFQIIFKDEKKKIRNRRALVKHNSQTLGTVFLGGTVNNGLGNILHMCNFRTRLNKSFNSVLRDYPTSDCRVIDV